MIVLEPYTPRFESPYPSWNAWRITDFQYREPLHLMRSPAALRGRTGGDADYIVAEPYTVSFRVDDVRWQLTVPAGMYTDLASVPWWARRVVNRVGPHLEASIVHDWLYVAWQDIADGRARRMDRDFADAVFLAGMTAAKVAAWQRAVIYRAVRLAGWPMYRRREAGPVYVRVM